MYTNKHWPTQKNEMPDYGRSLNYTMDVLSVKSENDRY